MNRDDDLLATIEAVHAAALDTQLWPRALERIAHTVGGIGCSLEAFERRPLRPREFYAYGMPAADQIAYFEHYAPLNPRWSLITRQKAGELGWDHLILDDRAMSRDPFYAEFLAKLDFPYLVYGMLTATEHEFSGIAVHRSRRQGHVDRAGIAVMQRLVPHVRQAFDMARRLKGAGETRHALERALDWLADGVALVRTDGKVVYANEAFQAIARRGDGIAIRRGVVDIAAAETRARFEAAVAEAARLRGGDVRRHPMADFAAPRSSGAPPYLIAVRPLMDRNGRAAEEAAAIVFVHDPLGRNAAAMRLLRDVFGFTESEANLAQALQKGIPPGDYARSRAVSLNTVYTHLRRIKEKTGSKRMAEVIRRLNDLQVAVRID
jgi:DNA-binding CsgD family transcriptional regulator/PAS domain-containing protein